MKSMRIVQAVSLGIMIVAASSQAKGAPLPVDNCHRCSSYSVCMSPSELNAWCVDKGCDPGWGAGCSDEGFGTCTVGHAFISCNGNKGLSQV